MSLRIRRGPEDQRSTVTPSPGEMIWTMNQGTGLNTRPAYKLYVGNGLAQGGIDIIESSVGSKLKYNTANGKIDLDLTSGNRLNTDDIIQVTGATNRFFTNELAQDAVATMFAAGIMCGITFVYDDANNRMNVTVPAGTGGGTGGLGELLEDTSPQLGGNLDLNSQNIIGIGNIDIDGYAILTGTLEVPAGLNSNLPLNGFDITGEGNITIGGDASFTGTIVSNTGLGGDLSLNGSDITGLGNINISGELAVNGLGANLSLNTYDLVGVGDINTSGNASFSGTLSATTGLGANLSLNTYSIVGTGDIAINGSISDTVVSLESGIFTSSTGTVTIDGEISADDSLRVLHAPSDTGVAIYSAADGSRTGPNISLTSYTGVYDTKTIALANDNAGSVRFQAWTNGSTGPEIAGIATINSVITSIGNGTTTFTKGKLQLVLLNGPGVEPIEAEFTSNGAFKAPIIQTGVYATNTERDAIVSPAAGMIIFNTLAGKFQGYTGAVWTDLN